MCIFIFVYLKILYVRKNKISFATTSKGDRSGKKSVVARMASCTTRTRTYFLPKELIKKIIPHVQKHSIEMRQLAFTCTWVANHIADTNPEWGHQTYNRVTLYSMLSSPRANFYINKQSILSMFLHTNNLQRSDFVLALFKASLKCEGIEKFNYMKELFSTVKDDPELECLKPYHEEEVKYSYTLTALACRYKKCNILLQLLPTVTLEEVVINSLEVIAKEGDLNTIKSCMAIVADKFHVLQFTFLDLIFSSGCEQNDLEKIRYAVLVLSESSGSMNASQLEMILTRGSIEILKEIFAPMIFNLWKLGKDLYTTTFKNLAFNLLLATGDMQKIEYYIENYPLPEEIDEDILKYAIKSGNIKVIEFLIARFDARELISTCPDVIDYAIEYGHLQILKFLLTIVNVKMPEAITPPFKRAILSHGNLEIVQWLHKKGVNNMNRYVAKTAIINEYMPLAYSYTDGGGRFNHKHMVLALRTENVELMRHVYEFLEDRESMNKGSHFMDQAVLSGNLEIIKWLHSVGFPFSNNSAWLAARYGNRVNLYWMESQNCPGARMRLNECWPNVPYGR